MMASRINPAETMRIGVFDDVPAAEQAVSGLVSAGFHRDQISVLCSDQTKERHFLLFDHEDPAGTHTAEAAAAGGLIGSVVGAMVSIGVSTAAGLSLVAAGPSFLVGGAVVGGLIGAMQTRGQEGALADFYDQALTQGKILVAAEDDSPTSLKHLQQAEQIFRDAGAVPVSLPEPSGPPPARVEASHNA
jgi:alpha-D-ribose 1-methylphosphonate 5-triphosphate diphosphatase PhnM